MGRRLRPVRAMRFLPRCRDIVSGNREPIAPVCVAQAAKRGDKLLDNGDLDGLLVWQAIISAIRRLQAEGSGGG